LLKDYNQTERSAVQVSVEPLNDDITNNGGDQLSISIENDINKTSVPKGN